MSSYVRCFHVRVGHTVACAGRFLKKLLAVFSGPTVCPGAPTFPVPHPADRMLRPYVRSRRRSPATVRASLTALIGVGLLAPATLSANGAPRRAFDIPAGDAVTTLRQFSAQSGEQLLYSPDDTGGVRTRAVYGEFVPIIALEQMLERTPLRARQDSMTKAIAVSRSAPPRAPPKSEPTDQPLSSHADSPTTPKSTPSENMKQNPPLSRAALWLAALFAAHAADSAAQTTPVEESAASQAAIILPAFETSSQSDTSYMGKSSLSSTRISVELAELPQSVQVINNSFLKAINPLNLVEVLNYVGGAQTGNLGFTAGRVNIRGFTGDGDYVDGFAPASSVLQDSALFDRFEVIKGPSTIFLAADGSPGGVVNKITQSPSPNAATSLSVQVGRFNANHASLDNTGSLTKDGALTYRLIVAQQYSDGRYDTTHLHRFTAMPSFTYRFSPTAKLELKALVMNAIFPSYTSIPVDPRTLRQFAIVQNRAQTINAPFQWYFHDKVGRVWANFTDRLNDHVVVRIAGMNAYDTLNRVVLQATTWNEGARTWTVPNYDGTQSFPRALIADDSNTIYRDLQSDVNINFNAGPVANNLLIGSELNYGVVNRSSHPGTASPWYPYSTATPVVTVNTATNSAQSSSTNTLARAFVLDTVKFFGDRIILSYGLSRARATASVLNQLTGA